MRIKRGHIGSESGWDWGTMAKVFAFVAFILGAGVGFYFGVGRDKPGCYGALKGALRFSVPVFLFIRFGMPLIYGIKKRTAARAEDKNRKVAAETIAKSGTFHLYLGRSTGVLAARSHGAGMEKGQDVTLLLEDACTNFICFGGIGGGKTTRAINPLLFQFLAQDCGGLIYDIKGDFKETVYVMAGKIARPIVTIGIGQRGLNLLKGLTPEIAATFLKSAFILGGSGGHDMFWVDQATELSRNGLGVLKFVEGEYSLVSLYEFIFYEDKRKAYIEKAMENISLLPSRETRLLEGYARYYEHIFDKFDSKVKQGILATASQVLSPFQHPDLIDYFCSDRPDDVDLASILNGDIVLVDLPLSTWGVAGKAVYTLIKLRFFNVLQSRPVNKELNQERPVFFLCDEYQEIISASKSGLSDLSFWDKSRSAKCIGVISGQSVNAFYAAIGDKDLAKTILANFRQKLCFRTEDLETLNYLNSLAGKVEVSRTSYTKGTSSSTNILHGSHSSESSTTALVERPPLDAQVMRSLGPDQAIAMLNIDGHAMDDIMNVEPFYV